MFRLRAAHGRRFGRWRFLAESTVAYPDGSGPEGSLPRSMETEEFGALLEYAFKRALNSAVECHPHTVEVIGSNPIAPTTSNYLRLLSSSVFRPRKFANVCSLRAC